ncbi:MAG: 2-hydroxyacid dehydrogenase [Methylobacteriaceae bacterium]|jgi:D-3-phosphoglycerate dehydrogenase|nr:2-hydroxyacid dehydrogenase [Methylobacteriaceae bacterium]
MSGQKAIVVGDAMILGDAFENAAKKYLGGFFPEVHMGNWEEDYPKLQERRLKVEQQGPEIEVVPDVVLEEGKGASLISGLFVPVSTKLMDAMPDLKIVGVARAGLENVNVAEATRRGILVFNIEGRNAQAVSDFAVGMMLCECRNMARAHYSIKKGEWRKYFVNSDWVPELKDKVVGLVGFGYIGRLVAKKLSGFEVQLLVHDPFVSESVVAQSGGRLVDKATLFRESDFVSLHARMSAESKGMLGAAELALMKPTAYLINTARAGLIDQAALLDALKNRKIAGAGLDVFNNEPLEPGSEFLELDNVTLTTHIAGTTREALTRSPDLLMEDIRKLLDGEEPRFIINRQVLDNPAFKAWLEGVRK